MLIIVPKGFLYYMFKLKTKVILNFLAELKQ